MRTKEGDEDYLRLLVARRVPIETRSEDVLICEVERLRAELSECRAQLQAFRDASEAAELRIVELLEELKRERMAPVREPGCQCTWEIGDSPCGVHPLDPDTELPYTPAKAAQLHTELIECRSLLEAFRAARRGES